MIIIDDWRVSPDTCTLSREAASDSSAPTGSAEPREENVRLSARSMDVLVYLAERPGAVVSSDELIERFWQSSSTTDHAVHKVIASLRRALGDSAHEPRFIKTLPKRGYSLIAPVTTVVEDTDAAQSADAAEVVHLLSPRRRSALIIATMIIAGCVLLLGAALLWHPEDISGASDTVRVAVLPPTYSGDSDPAQNSQLDELRAALITSLSEQSELDLIVVQPAGIGLEGGAPERCTATHSLALTAYPNGDELRLFINLVRLDDGVSLYAERFRLGASELAGASLVATVAHSLDIYLDEERYAEMRSWGTQDAMAYDHFLKARFYQEQYNHRDWKLSLAHYRDAVERDPQFINAYLGYGAAANSLSVYSRDARVEEIAASVHELSRQLALAVPGSPAVDTLKSLRMRIEGNNEYQQEREYREQILAGNAPGYVYARYALFLIGARLYDEAGQFLALARDNTVGPLAPNEAWNFQTQILPPPELAQAKVRQLLDKPSHIGILGTAISSLVWLGDYDKAAPYLQHQLEMDEDGVRAHLSRILMGVSTGAIPTPAGLARSGLVSDAGKLHNTNAARTGSSVDYGDLLSQETLQDPDLNFNNGIFRLLLGDLEAATEYWRDLTRIDQRKLFTRLHALEIFFPKPLLEDPDYAHLLEELGVGKSWQRRLMEGVMEMAGETGVALDEEARAAYENDRLMIHNNRWSIRELGPFRAAS